MAVHKLLNIGNTFTMLPNILYIKWFCVCAIQPSGEWGTMFCPPLVTGSSKTYIKKNPGKGHNAINLIFCVKEIDINITIWSIFIEIQDPRVARNLQVEPFSFQMREAKEDLVQISISSICWYQHWSIASCCAGCMGNIEIMMTRILQCGSGKTYRHTTSLMTFIDYHLWARLFTLIISQGPWEVSKLTSTSMRKWIKSV